MAKAPRVKPGGYDAANERKAEAQTVFRVTVEGTELDFTVAPNNLPVRIRRELRDQIGKSPRQFLGEEGDPDLDTVVILWWASRRVGGEQVPYLAVESEWDLTYGDVTYDRVSVVQVTAADMTSADADPEASGQPTS